jgi:hypothetical protein
MALQDNPKKKSTRPLDPKFGVDINKGKSKPKPAPSPTSYTQLNIDRATMAYVKKELQFTDKDPNTYSGTYKGKRYTWQSGGFLK